MRKTKMTTTKLPMRLIIEKCEVIPGELPDGTRMGKFLIETANLGNLSWMMTPRQARWVGQQLLEYGSNSE